MGYALSIFTGLCAGAVTGSALGAFYIALGVYSKLTRSMPQGLKKLAAVASFLGATVGTLFYLYRWQVGGGLVMDVVFGLFGGTFIGIYIALIAEVVEYVPFLRRLGAHKTLIGVALVAFAIGKAAGSVYYTVVYLTTGGGG